MSAGDFKVQIPQWILVGLTLIVWIIFACFIRYHKACGYSQDRLTYATFLFLHLTFLSRVGLSSVSMLLFDFYTPFDGSIQEYINEHSGAEPVVCLFDLSEVLNMFFFTIALFFNAVRTIYIEACVAES
jgi:hypothetical protein